MKKILSVILCCVLALSFTACSGGETNEVTSTEPTQVAVPTLTEEKKEKLANKLDDFEGIAYFTQNGEVVFSHAKGKDECGNDLTVDSPMYIASISKQFCATAVMMLKEQGKLSVDDTIDKYFPEYELGKDITIKNLLTMRSGIPEMIENENMDYFKDLSSEKTADENITIIEEWVFSQSLKFDPDTSYEYSNTNYFLLSEIVEMVSNQDYYDFIRKNIFEPLNMEHSGFIKDVRGNEFYSKSLTYDSLYGEVSGLESLLDGLLSKGAGDIVSTAPDMDKWMTGLVSGEIITVESYREMIADYSPDCGDHYGYGLSGMYKKGIGHTGYIGEYLSIDYINEEYGCNFFGVVNNLDERVLNMSSVFMDVLLND